MYSNNERYKQIAKNILTPEDINTLERVWYATNERLRNDNQDLFKVTNVLKIIIEGNGIYMPLKTNPNLSNFIYCLREELACLDENLFLKITQCATHMPGDTFVLNKDNYNHDKDLTVEDDCAIFYRGDSRDSLTIFANGFQTQNQNCPLATFSGSQNYGATICEFGVSTSTRIDVGDCYTNAKSEGAQSGCYLIKIPLKELGKYGAVSLNCSSSDVGDLQRLHNEVKFIFDIPKEYIYSYIIGNDIQKNPGFDREYSKSSSCSSSPVKQSHEPLEQASIKEQNFFQRNPLVRDIFIGTVLGLAVAIAIILLGSSWPILTTIGAGIGIVVVFSVIAGISGIVARWLSNKVTNYIQNSSDLEANKKPIATLSLPGSSARIFKEFVVQKKQSQENQKSNTINENNSKLPFQDSCVFSALFKKSIAETEVSKADPKTRTSYIELM